MRVTTITVMVTDIMRITATTPPTMIAVMAVESEAASNRGEQCAYYYIIFY